MQLILSAKQNLKSYTIPKEHSTWNLMVALLPLSFLAMNRTANEESYLQGKIPSHLFKGFWKISQEGMRTQRNFPPTGRGQKQQLSVLKLQRRKPHPFQLQQATWDTRQRQPKRGQQPAHIPFICPYWYIFLWCPSEAVSLNNGQSSMCQTLSSHHVIKGRTQDSAGNTWDRQ